MSHLTLEALARLVDEAPDPTEATHLARCAACQEELAALRDQTMALGSLPRMVPPPDAWPALRERLREEGLVQGRRGWNRGWRPSPAVTRAAAAVALFLGGGAAGWAARAPAIDPAPAAAAAPAGRDAVLASDTRSPGASETQAAGPGGGVDGAEEQFLAALDRFMVTTGTEATDPAARLAALDNIVLTTAEALNEAPADPVINSYFLMAQAQRRAVLRQIQASAEGPVF